MNGAFIRKGHGYENHSTQGRCTAFDDYDIIASPLNGDGDDWCAPFSEKARESRVFPGKSSSPGVTYASHSIKLGRSRGYSRGELFILMHNGSGREVLAVPSFYDQGDLEAAILAMPERVQYALLYTIWNTASNARTEAIDKTSFDWRKAIVEKRVKQKRVNGGVRVQIIEPWEVEMKARMKAEKAD